MPLTENKFSLKSTSDFASYLDKCNLEADEIQISYYVTLLFTEVPLDITFDYIIDQIYNLNKLPHLSSKVIFKRLLNRVTKGVIFIYNDQLYKQVDGCGMENPLCRQYWQIYS